MPKKFKGELNWIDPDKLVTEDKYNEVEGFFLSLGLVYNDLKGLIFFEKLLIDTYERPKDDEVTPHAGNYGGVIVQIEKLIASTINEFFILLKKNTDVFTDREFKQIFRSLAKTDQQLLKGMIAASCGKLPRVESLLTSILQIRNNFGYHYYQSCKALRNGYISRYFGKIKDNKNEFAYYSLGDTLEVTRFYFSDAAAQEALFIAAGKDPKKEL